MRFNRHAAGALAAAATLVIGGAGAALASSADGNRGDRGERCEARFAKLAEKRGVSVEQLQAEIKAKLLARIDAAEKAGRISTERAAKLRERVEAGSVCGDRKHVRVRVAAHGMLRAAAEFLGLDKAELRAQLPGTSLAGLAAKQGKTEQALVAAMVAPGKERLAKAVTAKKITQAQADAALDRLEELAARLATKTFPSR